MDLIGAMGDPKKVATALESLIVSEGQGIISNAVGALSKAATAEIIPALKQAGIELCDGLSVTITINISRKKEN